MESDLDLIIPVYHPDKKLKFLLERIQKQTKKPNRIILLHTKGKNNEDLSFYSNKYGVEIYPIKKDEFDHGATRAYGAELSNAEYMMFMTQDAVPVDTSLIANLIKGFKDEQVAICYGRQLSGKHGDIIEKFTRKFNYPNQRQVKSKSDIQTMGVKAFFCSDVCAVYKKKRYEELGGFIKKAIFNEDMVMAYHILQAGYKIVYENEARVIHSHQYTYMQQFRRNFDLGVSHRDNAAVFCVYKSEHEGIRLVKETAEYLIQKKQYWKLIDLFLVSAFKYTGYRLGKCYKKLPQSIIEKCTMNKSYWNKAV